MAGSSMHPLVGLTLGGHALTPFDDLGIGGGALGKPVWGPEHLLRDLELRLGIPTPTSDEALRTMRWAARMNQLRDGEVFYASSFELDPLGTARSVLELRDSLVHAGWDGTPCDGGGARIATIARLETLAEPLVPPGFADRVAHAARSLDGLRWPLYGSLTLAEPSACWSSSWRRVFEALSRAGTSLSQLSADLPGAPPATDLGKVQATLRDVQAAAVTLRGDGSLVLLTAPTAIEAAAATAAWVDATSEGECVVIREDDAATLENAFATRGMPSQGSSAVSPWRAAVQVLPLALELTFEPKDPARAYELLGLPNGPFAGVAARRMMRALARAPGIGGRPWTEAKERLRETHPDTVRRLGEWFEGARTQTSNARAQASNARAQASNARAQPSSARAQPSSDRVLECAAPPVGATKDELLATTDRVRQWLDEELKVAPTDGVLHAARGHCDALDELLAVDERTRFEPVDVTRLLALVIGPGERVVLATERAGRVDHVSSASALCVPRQTVVWWSFVHRHDQAGAAAWRPRELVALRQSGVHFPEPEALLAERARGWRRAALAASERLILVVPSTRAGQPCSTHPLWDEIVVRANLGDDSRARVTLAVTDLLERPPPRVGICELPALELPVGHPEWTIDAQLVPPFGSYSPHRLSRLIGCPLRFGLESFARIESEGFGLPAMHQLSGMLGHRLVEELHASGAFGVGIHGAEDDDFARRAGSLLDVLIEQEGAVLLRPGKGNERAQLRHQLVSGVVALKRLLADNRLRLVSVEQSFEVAWQSRRLTGRLDLLAEDDHGQPFIVDLKWGKASYAQQLSAGTAVQLAAYAFAYSTAERTPSAFYFSMKQARALALADDQIVGSEAVDGPDLRRTWQRVERTTPLVERMVQSGRLPVVGVRRASPLLETLGLDPAAADDHLTHEASKTCEYCAFDAVCGRRWEQLPW